MAANYWTSTQLKNWLFTREKLAETRRVLDLSDRTAVNQFPLPDLRLLSIYINQRELFLASVILTILLCLPFLELNKLGKRLHTRQQVLATAQVYIRRFYTKVEIRRTNPYLVLATAFYLACKTDECPQHIRLVSQEAKGQWPGELCVFHTSKQTLTLPLRVCIWRQLENRRMRVLLDI